MLIYRMAAHQCSARHLAVFVPFLSRSRPNLGTTGRPITFESQLVLQSHRIVFLLQNFLVLVQWKRHVVTLSGAWVEEGTADVCTH